MFAKVRPRATNRLSVTTSFLRGLLAICSRKPSNSRTRLRLAALKLTKCRAWQVSRALIRPASKRPHAGHVTLSQFPTSQRLTNPGLQRYPYKVSHRSTGQLLHLGNPRSRRHFGRNREQNWKRFYSLTTNQTRENLVLKCRKLRELSGPCHDTPIEPHKCFLPFDADVRLARAEILSLLIMYRPAAGDTSRLEKISDT